MEQCDCGRILSIDFFKRKEGGKLILEPRLAVEESRHNQLVQALERYWRWAAEGKKEFRRRQYYYDHGRTEIYYDPHSDSYTFSIRVKGDLVWSGRCKVDNHNQIRILEERGLSED